MQNKNGETHHLIFSLAPVTYYIKERIDLSEQFRIFSNDNGPIADNSFKFSINTSLAIRNNLLSANQKIANLNNVTLDKTNMKVRLAQSEINNKFGTDLIDSKVLGTYSNYQKNLNLIPKDLDNLISINPQMYINSGINEQVKAAKKALRIIRSYIRGSNFRTKQLQSEISYRGEEKKLLEDIEYAKMLMSLGWPPILRASNHFLKEVLLIRNEDGDAKAIEKLEKGVPKIYTKNVINEIRTEWNCRHVLNSRKTILDKALAAHISGDFELSIPIILINIEGVIACSNKHQGRLNFLQVMEYVHQYLGDGEFFDVESENELKCLMVSKFIELEIYTKFEHGVPSEHKLSRHAILHGGDTDYPSKINSLKAIVFMDAFLDTFRFACLSTSETFHLDTCRHISKKLENAIYFKNENDALKAGKKPCKTCM